MNAYQLDSSEFTALLEAGALDLPTEEKEYKGRFLKAIAFYVILASIVSNPFKSGILRVL